MPIKILHTSDIHLGAPMTSFGHLATQRKALLRQTFLNVCDLAVARKVHLFVCAGDLFDSVQPAAQEIECAKRGFTRLSAAQIPAFAVPGGHDGGGTFHNTLEMLALPGLTVLGAESVHAPRTLTLQDTQINLYGLAARAGVTPKIESMHRRELPGFHVGLLHATVLDSDFADTPDKDLPVTRRQLADLKLDYIALGHYHNFQIVELDQHTIGCYPGTVESKRFVETGPRCVALISLTKAGLNIEQIPVGQTLVETHRLRTDDLELADAVIRQLHNLGGPGKLARVTLTGLRNSLLDAEAIEEQSADAFAFLQVIDETEVAGDADVRTIAGEPTVRGLATAHLLRKLDAASEPAQRRKLHHALKLLLHEFDRHRKGSLG